MTVDRILWIGSKGAGFVMVAAAVAVLSAVITWPLARRTRDQRLLDINNPVEMGWASTARLLKPAAIVCVVSLVVGLLLTGLRAIV